MFGTPVEYLSLPNTLGDFNFSQYTAGGFAPGTDVRTHYSRVRLDPATLVIDIGDKTFASSSGSVSQVGTVITSMPYGIAADCIADFSSAGLANIDLTGTPFKVVDTFLTEGFFPGGGAIFSSNDQVVDLTGGGECGSTRMEGAPLNAALEFGPDTFVLDLEYFTDCNGNGVSDATDIAGGTSQDCNTNGIPDECEIPGVQTLFALDVLYGVGSFPRSVAVGDLDGDGDLDLAVANRNTANVSVLLHVNGDCNGNGVPDDCDLTSEDCNTNGIPDECDIGVTLDPATGTFGNDCNLNGIPDECEADFDTDGLPDECDPCAGGAASGDTDANGAVDLTDYADMEPCLQGPGAGLGLGCECFDFDLSGTIDLKDFAEFQAIFTGQ